MFDLFKPLVAGDQPQFSRPGDIFNRGMGDITNGQLPQTLQPVKKPGAFGNDGWAWKVLGVVGDGLQAAGGGHGTYMPAMLDMQQRVADERKWQAQLAQQAALKQQELQASASAPTAEQKNFEYYQNLPQEQRGTFDQYRRGDPNVTLTLPNNLGIYSGPQSGLGPALRGVAGGGGAGIPKVADQAGYDAVPAGGKYMTPDGHIRVKGGGSGNATGGFR